MGGVGGLTEWGGNWTWKAMDDILGPEGRARAGEGQRGRDADGPGAGYTSTGVLVYRVQDGPMSLCPVPSKKAGGAQDHKREAASAGGGLWSVDQPRIQQATR